MPGHRFKSLRRDIAVVEPARAWPLTPAIFALAACWLLFVWPWLFGYVTVPWDAKAQFLPQIQFLASSLARGDSPFWNPYIFGGHPQIADPQSMLFSPLALLALVDAAPGPWAMDTAVFLYVLGGGVAMLAWFRARRWHWAGGLIAALAFMFGAAMAWRIQHTGQVLSLATWPMALLALERATGRGSYLAGVAAGLAAAIMVLGRDQVALIGLYLLGAYVVWRWFEHGSAEENVRRSIGPLAVGGVFALALAAMPLLMTALLAADSNRPAIDLEGAGRGSLHPAHLLTAIIPQLFQPAGHMADYWGPPSFAWDDTGLFVAQNMGQLYIGAVPLLLLGFAAVQGWLAAREIRFFAVALVIVLAYALGWYTPLFRVAHALVPGVDLYRRPADAVFNIGALAAILAGYGAHRLFTTPWHAPGRREFVAAGVVAAVAVFAAVLLGVRIERLDRLLWPLLTAVVSFGAAMWALHFAHQRIALQPLVAAAGLLLVTTIDLSINNGPNSSSALPPSAYADMNPATTNATIHALKSRVVMNPSASDLAPGRRDRVELIGLGFHWPNLSMTHGLENTLGYNPVRWQLYAAATGAGDTSGGGENRKFTPLLPSYRSPMADLLGLRFIASGTLIEQLDPKLPAGTFPLVERTPEAFIYENVNALPRVLFATEAIDVGRHATADPAALLAPGTKPPFDPNRTVLIDRPALLGDTTRTESRRSGTARLVRYANTDIVTEADSPDGGFLVLNDIWHPWWYAEIDGEPAPLHKANMIFRAVEVPAGRHTVRFTFRPLQGAWQQWRGRTVN